MYYRFGIMFGFVTYILHLTHTLTWRYLGKHNVHISGRLGREFETLRLNDKWSITVGLLYRYIQHHRIMRESKDCRTGWVYIQTEMIKVRSLVNNLHVTIIQFGFFASTLHLTIIQREDIWTTNCRTGWVYEQLECVTIVWIHS